MEIWENCQIFQKTCTCTCTFITCACTNTSVVINTCQKWVSLMRSWFYRWTCWLLIYNSHTNKMFVTWMGVNWSRQQVTKNLMAALRTQLELTRFKNCEGQHFNWKETCIDFKTLEEMIHQHNLTYTLTTAWSIKSILFWTNTIGIPPHSSSTCKGMMQNMYESEKALHVRSTSALLMARYLSLQTTVIPYNFGLLSQQIVGFHSK